VSASSAEIKEALGFAAAQTPRGPTTRARVSSLDKIRRLVLLNARSRPSKALIPNESRLAQAMPNV
jgi:hypothetical protein